jgi:hypothetical protein
MFSAHALLHTVCRCHRLRWIFYNEKTWKSIRRFKTSCEQYIHWKYCSCLELRSLKNSLIYRVASTFIPLLRKIWAGQ